MGHLDTCHMKLKALAADLIDFVDCSVLEGHRNEEDQNRYYNATPRLSQVKFPDGKHNTNPSEAIHLAPYPYPRFEDADAEVAKTAYWEQIYFAGMVMATAQRLGIDLRWGGDWNQNNNLQDNKFDDLLHFELVIEKP